MKKLILSLLFFAGTAIAVAQTEKQDNRQEADLDKMQQEPQRPTQVQQERAARIESERLHAEKVALKKAKKQAKKQAKKAAKPIANWCGQLERKKSFADNNNYWFIISSPFFIVIWIGFQYVADNNNLIVFYYTKRYFAVAFSLALP